MVDQDLTTLGDHAALLRARWPLVLAFLVVGAVAGWFWSYSQPTLYRAEASVLVGSNSAGGGALDAEYIATQAEVVLSDAVVDSVLEQLRADIDPDSLRESTAVEAQEGTSVFVISTEQPTPQRAARVANAFADGYIDAQARQVLRVQELYRERLLELQDQVEALRASLPDLSDEDRVEARATLSSLQARQETLQGQLLLTDQAAESSSAGRVLQAARTPGAPSQPRPVWDTVLGAFLGLVLGVVAAYLLGDPSRHRPVRRRF